MTLVQFIMLIINRIIFYTKIALAFIWFCISCCLAMCCFVVKWKDPSMGAVFGRILHWLGAPIFGFQVRVEKEHRLYTHQPCIYVSNHQSNLDVFTMSCMYPYRTVVIGKKELKWVPFFGLFYVGAGNILIDRSDHKSAMGGLKKAHQEMKRLGLSLWLFVEGTRNRGSKQMLPFKKGAFYLAIEGGFPIVPIVHQHLSRYFDYKNRRFIPGEVIIKVLEPIETTGMTLEDLPALMTLVRSKMETVLAEPDMKPIQE